MFESSEPFEILLIEDELADANLVHFALKENKTGCRLHHVFDGIEALDFLNRSDEKNADTPFPDLILLDINMPRMNGYEFLRSIKADKKLAAIPVVVLSTSDMAGDIKTSYQMGAAGYITKPVDIDQFIEAISYLSQYWFVLVQLPKRA